MDISDYALEPASKLPPGGSERMDDAFMAWLRSACREHQTRMLDRHWRDLPPREFLPVWQALGHLFKHLTGLDKAPIEALNYRHRIRYCSIQFHYRSAEIAAELDRYAREQEAAFESRYYPEAVA
jgi:hypothetical protein